MKTDRRRREDLVKPLLVTLIAFILVVAVLSYAALHLAREADRNTHQIKQEQVAIEKSCILLNNAIIMSSKAAADPSSPTAALVEGLLTIIPPKYARLYEQRAAGQNTTVIPLVNCRLVAQHPDDIKATQLLFHHPTP